MHKGPIHPDQRLIVMYVCWTKENMPHVGIDVDRMLRRTFTSGHNTCQTVQKIIIVDGLKIKELTPENLSFDAIVTRDSYVPNEVRREAGLSPLPFLNLTEEEDGLEDFLNTALKNKLLFNQSPKTIA